MPNKSLLITVGPIPAKLDSVKLITNKFKGGLALKTAEALQSSHRITILAHTSTDIPKDKLAPETTVIRIEDVMDCYEKLRTIEADTYVLAGAVANLMPVNPWKGKFPSHNYKVGDTFNIPFTIAPRAINQIRKWHPNATLIGYKLFDGTDEELLAAGHETLRESGAHVVFCNHPAWAKTKKIALTQDGARIEMSFDKHIAFIARASQLEWYRTKATGSEWSNPQKKELSQLVTSLGTPDGKLLLGCAAYRHGAGFITTARGKSNPSQHVWVENVDHEAKLITATGKATLNAPTLARMFATFPDAQWILHGHQQIPDISTKLYAFPGTTEEASLGENQNFNVEHHGYYRAFNSLQEALDFLAPPKWDIVNGKCTKWDKPAEKTEAANLAHKTDIGFRANLSFGALRAIQLAGPSDLTISATLEQNGKYSGNILPAFGPDCRAIYSTDPLFDTAQQATDSAKAILETTRAQTQKHAPVTPRNIAV